MNASEPTTAFVFEAPQSAGDDTLVTVAVSLFNYEGEIESCLQSVHAQSHRRLEIIVVDDASTDQSSKVAENWLREHASRFERALLLVQPRNKGLSAARNLAFKAARADYVFVLDADNLLYPPAIERLAEVIEETGSAVAYSQLVYFEEMTWIGLGDLWRPDSFKPDNYIDAMALIRKSAWAEVGGYSPMDYGWEDYDFWCKLVEAGLKGVYVPELLCRYRVHFDSMRHTDTSIERERLVHGMMAAHPWLQLKVD